MIPEFQREYVWKKSKAPLLIDSLYRGFPVSSLLLWQSDEEARSRRREPRPARASTMSWLIDGQLWSGALIVPIIALCATTPPRQRDAKGLIAWIALATLLHRYSCASETALDVDLKACRESDPIGALLKNLREKRPSLVATPADFSGGLADRGGILALYVACMHRGVLDFYAGSKVVLQSNVDRHHLLPRAQFPDLSRRTADVIANIAFIVGDVNKSIGQTGPEVYLKRLAPRVLKSQCIPVDESLWDINRAEEFWDARRELLAESFNHFVRESLPQRRLGSI